MGFTRKNDRTHKRKKNKDNGTNTRRLQTKTDTRKWTGNFILGGLYGMFFIACNNSFNNQQRRLKGRRE